MSDENNRASLPNRCVFDARWLIEGEAQMEASICIRRIYDFEATIWTSEFSLRSAQIT